MDKIKIPFYYINLEAETEKREHMEHQLKQYVENYQRIEAVNGHNLKNELEKCRFNLDDQDYDINFVPRDYYKGFGCLLSHIKIYKLLKGKKGIFCICEDDLSFELLKNPSQYFESILKNPPKDWEIIKLHTSSRPVLEYCFNKEETFVLNDDLNTSLSPQVNTSTLIYLINDKFIDKFWSLFLVDNIITFPNIKESLPIFLPRTVHSTKPTIDGIIGKYFRTYNYNRYLFKTVEKFEENPFGIESNRIILEHFNKIF